MTASYTLAGVLADSNLALTVSTASVARSCAASFVPLDDLLDVLPIGNGTHLALELLVRAVAGL